MMTQDEFAELQSRPDFPQLCERLGLTEFDFPPAPTPMSADDVSVAVENAEKILGLCQTDRDLFNSNPSVSTVLGRSIYYWCCYPDLLNRIGYPDLRRVAPQLFDEAVTALNHLHDIATVRLMEFAEQYGIDPTCIHAAGQLCRTLHQTDFARYFAAGRSANWWPESLGSAILTLPETQQQLIRTAMATIQRIVVLNCRAPSGESLGGGELVGPSNVINQRGVRQPKGKRKRRRSALHPVALTAKQLEASKLHGECQGNIAEVARRMGVDRTTAAQHVEAAFTKLGMSVPKKAKTNLLKTDRRGQVDLTKSDDRRE